MNEFDEMKNIPKQLREQLAEECTLNVTEIIKCQVSKFDGTRKYLLRFADGNACKKSKESVRY